MQKPIDLKLREDTPSKAVQLDAVDEAILLELGHNARISNKALAEAVGIAPSTCLARVRVLQESGVVKGYHADISLDAIGLPISAVVSVRIHAQSRGEIRSFAQRIITLPNVLNVFFLASDKDFLIHVACASTSQLRDFVAGELSLDPAVAHTQTNLIFEHLSKPDAAPVNDDFRTRRTWSA